MYLPSAGQWAAALGVVERMEARGCRRDAATYSLLLTALDKGHQWRRALQVRFYWIGPRQDGVYPLRAVSVGCLIAVWSSATNACGTSCSS